MPRHQTSVACTFGRHQILWTSYRLHNALFGDSSKAAKSGIFGTMFLLSGMVKCPLRKNNLLWFWHLLMKSVNQLEIDRSRAFFVRSWLSNYFHRRDRLTPVVLNFLQKLTIIYKIIQSSQSSLLFLHNARNNQVPNARSTSQLKGLKLLSQ